MVMIKSGAWLWWLPDLVFTVPCPSRSVPVGWFVVDPEVLQDVPPRVVGRKDAALGRVQPHPVAHRHVRSWVPLHVRVRASLVRVTCDVCVSDPQSVL
jgi:hypothetical protein